MRTSKVHPTVRRAKNEQALALEVRKYLRMGFSEREAWFKARLHHGYKL